MIEIRVERYDDRGSGTYAWNCALCGNLVEVSERLTPVAVANGKYIGPVCLECVTNPLEVPERIGAHALELWRRAEEMRDLADEGVHGLKPGEVSAIFDEMGID